MRQIPNSTRSNFSPHPNRSHRLAALELTAIKTDFFATLPGVCPKWRIIQSSSNQPDWRNSFDDKELPNGNCIKHSRFFRHGGPGAGEITLVGEIDEQWATPQ